MPDQNDPMDYSAQYNTKLSAQEERDFQTWAEKEGRANDTYDYDLRGAYKELQSGEMTEADNGHLGDKYKKPNHPTFSDQSQYHGVDGHFGGQWEQGTDGSYQFFGGKTQQLMHDDADMERYFAEREPGNAYVRPGSTQGAPSLSAAMVKNR